MKDYASWNNAGLMAKKQTLSAGCDPDRVIHAIVDYPTVVPLGVPIYARDYTCSCGATGISGQFIPYDKSWMCMNDHCSTNGFGKPKSQGQKKAEKKIRFLRDYGVPADLCEARGTDLLTNQPLASLVYGISRNPDHFLLLAGKNGRGKSYASAAAMHEYMQNREDVHMLYVNSVDLHQAWKMEICAGGSGYITINKYSDYDLLVIDDLGINTPTENFNSILYSIIDKRKGKGTIISTNMNAKQFKLTFGEPIASRVLSGKIFTIEGQDRRFFEAKSDEWENSM